MDKKDVDKPDKSNTIVYTIRRNEVKSARLKRIRGVSFKEIIIGGEILDIIQNPKRREQRMLILKYKRYVWVAPCLIEEDGLFLKTLYPCRKYHKIYGKGGNR
jgi:hypothetical protein